MISAFITILALFGTFHSRYTAPKVVKAMSPGALLTPALPDAGLPKTPGVP